MSAPIFHKGLRFGLLLQLAVGPVCLFVLQTSTTRSVWHGISAAWGVALVDAFYIAMAAAGVTRWTRSGAARLALRYAGATIIAFFAADLLAATAGVPLLPSFSSSVVARPGLGSLLGAALLAASNPLTILFWAGVFGAKLGAEGYGRRELWLFSLGCLSATVIFLLGVALTGGLIGRTAPGIVLQGLNVIVACALLYFAARLAFSKNAAVGQA